MTRTELVATYVAALPAGRAEAAAEAFASGQTIGTWTPVPGITDEMRAAHGGRVVEVREASADEVVAGEPAGGRWILRVAFPVVNIGPSFPMLFTTLLGNDPSTSIAARLVDLELPTTFIAAFPGPRFGIDGWRALSGVAGRPILLNMIKPCTGYPPEVGAAFVREVAEGGVDLVKDDELLASPEFSHVRDRARAYSRTLDQVAAETGHRARYLANVTSRARDLRDTAHAAVEGGADALMVNGLAVGLDPLADLVGSEPGVPVFVHTAGVETLTGSTRSGYGHALLLGRLLRLAGADAVLTSTPLAERPLPAPVFHATTDALRASWRDLLPSMPVVGGGLRADHVHDLYRWLGVDVILGVGGAIQGHPDGPGAGVGAVLAAIHRAVAPEARSAEPGPNASSARA